jgi:hypothetical protein
MPRMPKQKIWFMKTSWTAKGNPLLLREKLGQYFDLDTTDARLLSELRIWGKK